MASAATTCWLTRYLDKVRVREDDMKVVRDESVDRQALQDAVCDAVYGQETTVKITIDVEKLDGRELHFFERIGEGTYGDVEFEVFSTVPERSLEIWVQDERYLVSNEDLIEATLQAVIEPSEPTLGERVDRVIESYRRRIDEAQKDYEDCPDGYEGEIAEYLSTFRMRLDRFTGEIARVVGRYVLDPRNQ
jgi:hypothetical protein